MAMGKLWKLKLYLVLVPCDIVRDIMIWMICKVFDHDWTVVTASNWDCERYKLVVCSRCYKTPEEVNR